MFKNVLCIEDSRIMQNIYKRMMNAVGFADNVIAMYNGQEAIDYYKNLLNSPGNNARYPDLVFLDLNLPVMGGWDFLNEFEELSLPPDMEPNIIILTSSVDPKDQERAKRYPAILSFLSKPLTMEMLEELGNEISYRR